MALRKLLCLRKVGASSNLTTIPLDILAGSLALSGSCGSLIFTSPSLALGISLAIIEINCLNVSLEANFFLREGSLTLINETSRASLCDSELSSLLILLPSLS